jgi:hypothetical protein
MKSVTALSYDSIPGTAAPLIGISSCAEGETGAGVTGAGVTGAGVTGGATGGVVGSPPQDSSTARHAIQPVVIAIDRPDALRTRLAGRRKQEGARSRMDDPCGW